MYEKNNALIQALENEYKKIEGALSEIGYTVIKLDFESVGAAACGRIPDLRIWAREQENA